MQSESITELMAALNQAQQVMNPAKKDKENPFFHSHYADLGTVWDALAPFREAGIVFTQSPVDSPAGFITLDTQLTHAKSGQWIRGRLTLPLAKQDPQGAGSAITYARRYSLGCMTGLVTEEDDDGNAASHQQGKTFAQKFPAAVPKAAPDPPPATEANGVPFIIKIGRQKGQPVSDQSDENLQWVLDYYQVKLRDPINTSSRFRHEWEEAVLAIEEEKAKR